MAPGIKITYAVYADIRRGTYLTRASLRIDTRFYAHPGGRVLGRVEKQSSAPFRIPEICAEPCVDRRLGSASAEIARAVADALNIRLREFARPSRRATYPSRDW